MGNFLFHQKPHAKKHTRRTFAGNFISDEKKLIIGITGNHENDRFVRSIGKEIATDRASEPKNYLQQQGKQIILENITAEKAKEVFFETIKTL